MGGKNARNEFFTNTRIVQAKNVGKKIVGKNGYYTHMNIVTKKWGKKKARYNFSRNTRIELGKNVAKIIVGKVR